MRPNACGRADLVRAMGHQEADLLPALASLLGYERTPTVDVTVAPESLSLEADLETPEMLASGPEGTKEPFEAPPLVDVPFWRLERREILDADRDLKSTLAPEPTAKDSSDVERTAACLVPLSSWSALLPKLRTKLAGLQEGSKIDTEALIRQVSLCRQIDTLPRERRLAWGQEIQVILDKHQHLIPYWQDQHLIYRHLCDLFPRGAVFTADFSEGSIEPLPSAASCPDRIYRMPPPGTAVLVLGDLGILDHGSRDNYRSWLAFGRRLRDNGNRPIALVPCDPGRWPREIATIWTLISWDRTAGAETGVSDADTQACAKRLLRLVSPAVRVEPGLLRATRLLLADHGMDAGIESDVWQDSDVVSKSSVAATLDPDRARELREAFRDEDPELRRRFLKLLHAWHALDPDLADEIWFEEILSLDESSQRLIPYEHDLSDAVRFVLSLDSQWGQSDEGFTLAVPGGWLRRLRTRLPDSVWQHPEIGPVLQRLWWLEFRNDPDPAPPEPFDPSHMPRGDEPPQRLHVRQAGDQLVLSQTSEATQTSGSPMAEFMLQYPLIRVDAGLRGPFWRSASPPDWASNWGSDEFGSWVEFEVKEVRQRMRWIAAGSFLMGSPEGEPERQDREGPQHEVTLTRGFWMFDTAVTQALWQAVMGENPSRFKGNDRPVENVSWEDCQQFIERVNDLIPGLDLSLPTETQWEYACRAGTTTPFSFGENITPEQVNYDGHFPYANGVEGEYRQETLPVASLPANPWGLYEMHGNLWEWCADAQRKYTKKPEIDPQGPMGGAADRVLRGGGWIDDARDVRSACRSAFRPGGRDGSIGFRCLRVQQEGQEAEPAGPGLAGVAEQRPARDLTGGAELVRVGGSQEAHCRLPQAPKFLIASDCERLEFNRIIKPNWATAIGRDRFGLWTEFEYGANEGATVTQRMRWVVPGRFLMGSPPTEEGREDNEGPQHEVRLTQGFWMFDTAVGQALWQAVMGENPSRFESEDRPVERVTWHQCQEFIGKTNERISGLDLSLPTEAQWEYACRAGSSTATYAGDLEILGVNKAPILDAIAWYGGNSGVNFDLDKGHDSSGWPEKQHEHRKAGTRIVGKKDANPWGLYDILGNVWEWCLDGRRRYEEETATDPRGPMDDAAVRVLRGGSWINGARSVRSAYRFAARPDFRNDYIGFRCLRVQQEGKRDQEADKHEQASVLTRLSETPFGPKQASRMKRKRK